MCGNKRNYTWSHPSLFADYPKLNNLFKRWHIKEVGLCVKDYRRTISIREALQDWENAI